MAQNTIGEANPVVLAAELRPLLTGNAALAERERRLPTENVEEMQAANLFNVMTPKRWSDTVRRSQHRLRRSPSWRRVVGPADGSR
jgi:hypothetical protein